MSIEKLNNNSQSHIEYNPFTQVSNKVIQHIKDNDAFRIWVFLLSKSMEWTVIKEWTAKTCEVAERKARKVWSYLQRCNLITTESVKNEKGQITKWDLKVLNGNEFNIDTPFIDSESKQSKLQKEIKKTRGVDIAPVGFIGEKENKNHRCKKPPCGETTRVDIAPLLNKENTKQISLTKQKKSFYGQKAENEKRHDFAKSKDQMAMEAKSIAEHEKIKAIEMEGRRINSTSPLLDEYMQAKGIKHD